MLYSAQVFKTFKIQDWILEWSFVASSDGVLSGSRIFNKHWIVLQENGWLIRLDFVQ
jgi:hypothetical protein